LFVLQDLNFKVQDMKKKIAIVGFGNMGRIFYEILSKFIGKADLYIIKRESVWPNDIDIFVLAVKPQQLAELEVNKQKFAGKIIVSMLAGVSISRIQNTLGVEKVYRIMPNLGMKVGQGIIMKVSQNLSVEEEQLIDNMLASTSEIINCKTEDELDKLTAIFASGPAYYFYLSQILAEECKRQFGDTHNWENLTLRLLISAAEYAQAESKSFEELRSQVTSKGGITAAAISELNSKNWNGILRSALQAGYERAKEL
jgi:pyrroline-5-carboxylate reductase